MGILCITLPAPAKKRQKKVNTSTKPATKLKVKLAPKYKAQRAMRVRIESTKPHTTSMKSSRLCFVEDFAKMQRPTTKQMLWRFFLWSLCALLA